MADAWLPPRLVVGEAGSFPSDHSSSNANSLKVLPWDLNIRTHVSEPDIFYLAAYYNMSTFSFKSPDRPKSNRRRYLLELSPYAKDREQADPLHPADARWIDTETGLSIDVYAVRYNLTHPGGEGMLSCKDGSEIMV
jgi:hypothetical protein